MNMTKIAVMVADILVSLVLSKRHRCPGSEVTEGSGPKKDGLRGEKRPTASETECVPERNNLRPGGATSHCFSSDSWMGPGPRRAGGCSEQVSSPRTVKTSGRTAAPDPEARPRLREVGASRLGLVLGSPSACRRLRLSPSGPTSPPAPADAPRHPRCWQRLVEPSLPRTARALRTSSSPAAYCQSCPRTPAGRRPRAPRRTLSPTRLLPPLATSRRGVRAL